MSDITETQIKPPEEALPLGFKMSDENLLRIGIFIEVQLQKRGRNDPDFSNELQDAMARLDSTSATDWDPELATVLTKGLIKNHLIYNIGTEEEIHSVASSEEAFQDMCAKVIGNDHAFIGNLEFASALLPEPKVQDRVDSILDKDPYPIMNHLKEVLAVLPKEKSKSVIKSALDKIQRPETVGLYMMTPEIVEIVGQSKAQEIIQKKIAEGVAKGNIGDFAYHASKFVDQDLVKAEELMEIANKAIESEKPADAIRLFNYLASAEKLSPDLKVKITDRLTQFILNPDSSTEDVKAALSSSNVFGYEYNETLLLQAFEEHGPNLVALMPYAYRDVLGATRLAGILAEHIDVLGERMREGSENAATEIVSTFAHRHELLEGSDLTEEKRKEILFEIAEKMPGTIISVIAYIKKEADSSVDELLGIALGAADYSELVNNFENITTAGWRTKAELFTLILDKSVAKGEAHKICQREYFTQKLDTEHLLILAHAGLAEVLTEDGSVPVYELPNVLTSLVKRLSAEASRELLEAVPSERQLLTRVQIAVSRPHFFDSAELGDIVEQVRTTDDQKALNYFMQGFASLGHYFSRSGKTEQFIDDIFQRDMSVVILNADKLFKFLSPDKRNEYLQTVEQRNPAALLQIHNRNPIDGVDPEGIIQRMTGDSRIAYADKFFKKLFRRLPNAEKTTAYEIMLREAMGVFQKINRIEANPAAHDLFDRVKSQKGRSISSEVSLLQGVSLLCNEGAGKLELIDSAKALEEAVITRSYGRVGVDKTVELGDVEGSIANFMPLATYVEDYADKAHRETLSGMLEAVAKDEYIAWKYQTSDFSRITQEGLIPKQLTSGQYEHWQTSEKINIAEIGAVDTDALARKLIATLVQEAQYIPELERILTNATKPSVLQTEAREGIREIGKQTAQLHRSRKEESANSPNEPSKFNSELEELSLQRKSLEYVVTLTQLMQLSGEEVAAGRIMNEKGKLTNKTIQAALKEIVDRGSENIVDILAPIEMELSSVGQSQERLQNLTVQEVDDLETTIEIGAYPVGSCQHYEEGSLRAGLLGYTDPSVKIIAVTKKDGGMVARSIVRLVSDSEGNPAILVEPVYTSYPSPDIEAAILESAAKKAEAIGAKLFVSRLTPEASRAVTPTHLFQEGMRAPFLYSDVGGGLKSKEDGTVKYEVYQYNPRG